MAASSRLCIIQSGILSGCVGAYPITSAGSTTSLRRSLTAIRAFCSKSEAFGVSEPCLNDTTAGLKKRPLASSFLQQPVAGISQVAPQVQSPPPPISNRTQIPLTKPLPGLPQPVYAEPVTSSIGTRVDRLQNGVRVASEPKFGQFCTVGVAIDAGSRFEVALPSGVSHFIDKLAFGSTPKYPNGRDAILEELERYGGICDCQGSRDTMIYGISVETRGLEKAVEILAEVVLRPLLSPEYLEMIKTLLTYELEDLNTNPNPEGLLQEYIHAAAFRDNSLGLPRLCPAENIEKINCDTIYRYLAQLYDPKRIVLAGVGIEHERLLEAAQVPWNETLPIWQENPSLLGNETVKPVDISISQYTGGEVIVEKDLSNVSLGPNPMPELAHVIIGLESPSHQEESDFIATCVLNMMMGGGGSFSAGGPGKGMYTRLYINVLNRYHWIQHAAAYNHSYADSGVFCVHASCDPSHLRELVEIVTRELVAMAGNINWVELNRAKKQLQSMLLMNLESRPVVFEDVARQVLTSGTRKDPNFYIDAIGNVEEEDIQRVAKRMLKSKPSVAALGTLKKLPMYSDICEALTTKDGRLPKRFNIPWARN